MMLNATLFSAECLVVLLVLICVYIIARRDATSVSGVMQDDSGVYDTVTSRLGPSSHDGSLPVHIRSYLKVPSNLLNFDLHFRKIVFYFGKYEASGYCPCI